MAGEESSQPPIASIEAPQMVSSVKLPILNKDEHLARFHGIKDVKTLWAAIKTRFGEGLDKGYDRFQRLLNLLEIHREGIDTLDIDDMYNNLKVYEADFKCSFGSSSNSQNVAFVFVESTSNTNELNDTYSVSTARGHSSQAQGFLSYADELMCSIFANQSGTPQLDKVDLEQIDQDDLEEIDLKWQVAMLSMRVKRFYKKTRRKLKFNRKEPIGFDKTKVECYNCHRRGHFSKDCRSSRNSRNKSRDVGNAGYRGRDNGKRPAEEEEEEQALVVQDGLGTYDWSYQVEKEATEFALMDFTLNPSCSSSSHSEVQSCSKQCEQSYEQLKTFFDEHRQKLSKANIEIICYQYGLESMEGQLRAHQQNEVLYEEKIRVLKYQVKDKCNLLKYTQKQLDEALKEKEDLKAKLEKFETCSKNLTKLLDSQISAKVKTGLGYDSQLNEKEVLDIKKEEVTESVFDNRSSDEKNSVANDRFKKGEGYHVVPSPLTGNFMPPKPDLLFAGLDDSICKFKISETVTSLVKDEKDAPENSTACVEKPKEDWSSALLIEDWETHSNDDIIFTPEPITTKIDFVKAVVFTWSGRIPVSASKPKAASTSAAKPVNTAGPKQSVNFSRKRISTDRGNGITTVKTSTCCVWRPRVNAIDQLSKIIGGSIHGHPQQALKNKGIVDSRCSRHMTGNKAYLVDYQEIHDGGFVAFGSSRGTQDIVDAGKEVSTQHYIVLPLWSSISSTYKSSDDKPTDDKPKDGTGSKTVEEPINKEDQAYKDELDRPMSQEKEASDAANVLRKDNPVNAASTSGSFSVVGPSSPHPDAFIPTNTLLPVDQDDSQIPNLEETAELQSTCIFNSAYDDDLDKFDSSVQSMGVKGDFNNTESSVGSNTWIFFLTCRRYNHLG
nr:hypothetical protein [Tanacetum cinerariifolium]